MQIDPMTFSEFLLANGGENVDGGTRCCRHAAEILRGFNMQTHETGELKAIVIMYDHVSCKNVGGLHGLFEDQARERGIHLIWIPHDVMDPRTVSRREMREAFNQ